MVLFCGCVCAWHLPDVARNWGKDLVWGWNLRYLVLGNHCSLVKRLKLGAHWGRRVVLTWSNWRLRRAWTLKMWEMRRWRLHPAMGKRSPKKSPHRSMTSSTNMKSFVGPFDQTTFLLKKLMRRCHLPWLLLMSNHPSSLIGNHCTGLEAIPHCKTRRMCGGPIWWLPGWPGKELRKAGETAKSFIQKAWNFLSGCVIRYAVKNVLRTLITNHFGGTLSAWNSQQESLVKKAPPQG